jgi:hypothetical protein
MGVANNGQNMVAKRMANEFIIWRAGNSVKWDCTAQDISDETGLCIVTVKKACERKRWILKGERENTEDTRVDTYRYMRLTVKNNPDFSDA